MPPRDVVSVEITSRARKRLRTVCIERGMIQKQLGGRVIEWFADLAPVEQDLILQQSQQAGADREFLASMLIRRLAGEISKDPGWAFRTPLKELVAKAGK